jgi:glycosyltransferase involved in cell wall biosynthesis
MKIAFVYDVIYPFVKGGVEKRVWELAVRLTQRGHEVHIIGMKFWEGNADIVHEGVTLHGICPAKSLYTGGRRTIGEPLYFSIHLLPFLAKHKFDIIDCQQFPYFPCFIVKYLTFLQKTSFVITWHEVWGDYWYTYLGSAGLFGKWIERRVSRLTRNVITVSATTARNLEALGYSGELRIIPNGVDLPGINAIQPHQESSDILFVGRLIPEKQVDLLVKAVAILYQEMPDCRLSIIGDGPEQASIAAIIHESRLENNVTLIGFRESHDEIIARMKSSKIFVLPSMREGFGIAALEALACGLPVVTLDHPANAVRDLISNQTGFLSSASPEDLADKIKEALRIHTTMKPACIASAQSYDWNTIVDLVEQNYESALTKRKIP